MKRLRSTLTLVLACLAPIAHADVLGFDDLVETAYFGSNYRGFQFGTNDTQTTAWFYTDESSPYYTPHSGSHYVATDFSLYSGGLDDPTQPISRSAAFYFDGAYFSGGDTVRYQLYDGAVLVHTSAASAPLGADPIFVASGYAGLVTSVVVVGHQGFYALDDFTYRDVVAAVPEPETLPLVVAGLAGLGVAARRRRR